MNKNKLPLYRLTDGVTCVCSNVHNIHALKGRAGADTRIPRLNPGEHLDLFEMQGPAVMTRLWLTFDWPGALPYQDAMLRNRSVFMEITWDGADTPAVNVPVGDFFCHPLGYDVPFENAFFGAPVGRSLLCFIPMPFRQGARIRLVSAFDRPVSVFHDIRLIKGIEPDPDDGYLHACFRRTVPQTPGPTHAILPRIKGRGRYLGTHLGIITDRWNPLNWHGQNLKFFFDGDDALPSIMGASLDDFAGASWAAERPYMQRDSGLLVSRTFRRGGGHFGMYCYHRRDPLYFSQSCAVTTRPLIGLTPERLLALLDDYPGIAGRLSLPSVSRDELAAQVKDGVDGWHECGRLDDMSSVALYYLDRPAGDHEPCPPDVCRASACHWPAPDADKLLGDPVD